MNQLNQVLTLTEGENLTGGMQVLSLTPCPPPPNSPNAYACFQIVKAVYISTVSSTQIL